MLSGNIPFIVKSRGNNELIQNLKKDKDPILFDGLHTTYILNLSDFKKRKLFLRAHNVEHKFYKGLAEPRDAAESQGPDVSPVALGQ